ncbi:hypothetical protein T492DRAFT_900155 [Pavlovales sp. CCMP2436]|nr:hypothetical protein T492DRAFT_900155 [Pavlovales sp. CCMP2436]
MVRPGSPGLDPVQYVSPLGSCVQAVGDPHELRRDHPHDCTRAYRTRNMVADDDGAGDVILLGLAPGGELAGALAKALADALTRGDAATATLCLELAGDAHARCRLACAMATRPFPRPLLHVAVEASGDPSVLLTLLSARASAAAVDGLKCRLPAAGGWLLAAD